MPSTIGPLFAVLAKAPAEWNQPLRQKSRDRVLLFQSQQMAYTVEVISTSLLSRLDQSEETWVLLAQVMKEDGESLFAFATPLEREFFIELRELDSIGSRASAIALSEIGIAKLIKWAQGEKFEVSKVPGLGPKTLEKLKNGLVLQKEKFLNLLKNFSYDAQTFEGAGATRTSMPSAMFTQALEKLGLKGVEISRVYKEMTDEMSDFGNLNLGEQVKIFLQYWAQTKLRRSPSSAEFSS